MLVAVLMLSVRPTDTAGDMKSFVRGLTYVEMLTPPIIEVGRQYPPCDLTINVGSGFDAVGGPH
jgi:hypothetical protein